MIFGSELCLRYTMNALVTNIVNADIALVMATIVLSRQPQSSASNETANNHW